MIVKICGITNTDDALHALSAGADWIGLNLVAGPRRIDLPSFDGIASGLEDPSRIVALVQLTEGLVATELVTRLRDHGIHRLQLYGRPTPTTFLQVASEGFESIHVQPVADENSLAALEALLESCRSHPPGYVLLDAGAIDRLGGTGRRIDWDLLTSERAHGKFTHMPPIILAGGLTPENVAQAIQKVSPAGVDVSSGVESRPGLKDRAKVEEFIREVRAVRDDRP